jgi:hypothetical protein
MLYRWRRIDTDKRQHFWRLYGWFCGLIMCGSCVGAVTWAAWLQVIVSLLSGNDPTPLAAGGPRRFQRLLFWAAASRWRVLYVVSYAIEFLCLSVAKLTVLDRMSTFAGQLSKRWSGAGRAVLIAVSVGNVAGLAGNIAAAVQYERAASIEIAASEVWAVNNSVVGRQIEADATRAIQHAHFIASFQEFCEVAVLLLIVLSFVVVGAACARRVASALSALAAGSALAGSALVEGRHLRLQILATTAVVFTAFLLRSIYSLMSALANKLQVENTYPMRSCSKLLL